MCSIEGTTDKTVDIQKYTAFNKSRGPDGTDYFSDGWISLGHNYLAISPNPDNKTQPFVTPKGNVLLFNGEIYGLPEGTFDTEWLANYLDENGIGGLKYDVNGMWAIAWYEPEKNRLTLCRDHFGVKPLYYSHRGDSFYFSSTMRPLLATIEEKVEDDFGTRVWFHNDRFSSGSRTMWKDIGRVIPGGIIEYDLKLRRITARDTLWGNNGDRFNLKPNHLWDEEEMEEIFIEAFNEVAYAPGIKKTISLSGGLDSTLIASLTKHQDNLSASCVKWLGDAKVNDNDGTGWMDESDYMLEYDLAVKTAKQYNLPVNTIKIKEKDAHKYNDEIQFALSGQPHWDRNRTNPRYMNIMNAAKAGNRIYMCGDGADELLTGYNGHFSITENKAMIHGPNMIERFAKDSSKWRMIKTEFPTHLLSIDPINNYLFIRGLNELDSFCTVADSFTGAFGMESRMPFLHQKLAKYLLKIPGAIKIDVPIKVACKQFKKRISRQKHKWFLSGHYKRLIRLDMGHHIPNHVKNKDKKVGFAHPWDSRGFDRNKVIGEADWEIQKEQVKYFDMNVDFKPKLKDNVKQFESQ